MKTGKTGTIMEAVNIKSLILFIVAFLNLALGGFVYFKNRKDKINLFYALTALSTAGWATGIAFFRLSSNSDTAIFFAKFTYVAATLIGLSFLSFSFVFPFIGKRPKKIYRHLFLFFTVLTIIISAWPNLMIKKAETALSSNIGILTPLVYVFAIYFILCMTWAFSNFFQKYKTADCLQKIQIKYVFIGTQIAAIWGIIFDLILPILGNWELNWLGPYFTVVMVGLIAYAILKYHLMNIKVILTDFLVGTMGVVLLVLPFLMPAVLLKAVTAGIFVLFCFFGYYLVKATYREARQKEEAQKSAASEAFQKEEAIWMAKVLKEASEIFEKKLKERTKELKGAKDLAEQKTKEAEEKTKELEKFYRLSTNRGLKMTGLKKELST